MNEEEYFKYIKNQISKLSEKEYAKLEDFLHDMEQSGCIKNNTIKEYKSYIKKFKNQNKILFIAFKTKDKNKLAHICKYILDLEWNNEWALAVAGQHTKTIFGWFD